MIPFAFILSVKSEKSHPLISFVATHNKMSVRNTHFLKTSLCLAINSIECRLHFLTPPRLVVLPNSLSCKQRAKYSVYWGFTVFFWFFFALQLIKGSIKLWKLLNYYTTEPLQIMPGPQDISSAALGSHGRPSRRPIKRTRSRASASHQRSWP